MIQPRFSFGMIVFNGATFLEPVLESVYQFAHEIIIIEGPDRNGLPMASRDGHSRDRTLEILQSFPDPDKKLKVISGIWNNKDEQSNRYIVEATGDYIWQIDDDEVYKPEDLIRVRDMLVADPEITAVSFYWHNFFKSFDRIMVADPPYEVWRLFRLRPGYRFSTHRPPTVFDPNTGDVMNQVKPLRGATLAEQGIYCYHYSYVFDQQVEEKIRYHTEYRLSQIGVAMPPVPKVLSSMAPAWRWIWNTSPLRELRKRKDSGFFYDYMSRIWRPWDADPQGIEETYGISPSPGPYRRTTRFLGTHPSAILRRHPQASGQ